MAKYRKVWHPFCSKEEPGYVGRAFFLCLATVNSGAILLSLGASKCVMADRSCRITFTFCLLFWRSYGTMTATFITVLHSGMHSWDKLGFLLYGHSVYRFWQNNQSIPKRIFIKLMRYGSLFLIRMSQFLWQMLVFCFVLFFFSFALDSNLDQTFNVTNSGRHGDVVRALVSNSGPPEFKSRPLTKSVRHSLHSSRQIYG